MSIDNMKDYILGWYPNASKSWRTRVRDFMPDNQIVAIYHSICRREEKLRREAEEEKKYHQMTIYEYIGMEDK